MFRDDTKHGSYFLIFVMLAKRIAKDRQSGISNPGMYLISQHKTFLWNVYKAGLVRVTHNMFRWNMCGTRSLWLFNTKLREMFIACCLLPILLPECSGCLSLLAHIISLNKILHMIMKFFQCGQVQVNHVA